MKQIYTIVLILLLCTNFLFCYSDTDTTAQGYYLAGLKFVKLGDLNKAEYFLKKSIREEKTALTEFELAKIYISEKTINGRAKARKLLTNALFRDPNNIQIRLLKAALMESFSDGMAFKEYEKIIEIDSTNITALFQMGRFKEKDFNDYHKSVFQDDPFSPMLSLEEFAMDDFYESENYFLKILRLESDNPQALLHLSTLYEDLGKPEKGIPFLERLVKIEPNEYSAHLFLGLLCYENSQNKKAHEEYKKALYLMSSAEEEDFTFNSVKELIKPIFKDKFEDFTDAEMRLLIKEYWKIKEPLYLTKYNERLLEHYSRVTYANLRFSLPKENKPGWQTDRGDIYLRYGEPVNRIRFRPHINAGGRTQVNLKTDVWYYTDMVFGFTDDFMNGNFRFSTPTPGSRYVSQFAGDSYRYANYVKSVRNELYDPKFEGPKFKVPYQITQFKNLNNPNETDVYVHYGLDAADTLLKNNLYVYPHVAGFFYSDGYYNLKKSTIDTLNYFDQSKKIELSKGKELLVNSLNLSLSPDSGYFALELLRGIDKGVSANHDKLTVKKFDNISLDISDIVLASDIETENEINYTLKRRNINILPNPSGIFTEKYKLFIYYELYNVNLNGGVGEFEQTLTLKKTDDRSGFNKAVNSVLNIFGMGNENKEIILTTKYQVTEKDPQIYFQLDMNKYEAGDYSLELLIKDKNSGEEVKEEKIFSWK